MQNNETVSRHVCGYSQSENIDCHKLEQMNNLTVKAETKALGKSVNCQSLQIGMKILPGPGRGTKGCILGQADICMQSSCHPTKDAVLQLRNLGRIYAIWQSDPCL